MAVIRVKTFEDNRRNALEAEMNVFLLTIAPIDVLELKVVHIERYLYFGYITYYIP